MLAVYLDGSGDDGVSLRQVIGGFIADVNNWVEFEKEWAAFLREPRYNLEYAHAKEIAQWPRAKRQRFYVEANHILRQFVLFSIATTVKKRDYLRVFPDNTISSKDSLYGICFRAAMIAVCHYTNQERPGERVAFFLEKGDRNQGAAERMFHGTIEETETFFEYKKDYPLETFTLADKDDFGALQAADLHVYSRLRYLEWKRFGDKGELELLLYGINSANLDLDEEMIRDQRVVSLAIQKQRRWLKAQRKADGTKTRKK